MRSIIAIGVVRYRLLNRKYCKKLSLFTAIPSVSCVMRVQVGMSIVV